MIQLGLLLVAGSLLWSAMKSLNGDEPDDKQTPRGVAFVAVVLAVSLAVFAIALPTLLQWYMGDDMLDQRVNRPRLKITTPRGPVTTKPPQIAAAPVAENAFANAISITITAEGTVLVGEQTGSVEELKTFLIQELEQLGAEQVRNIGVAIYADSAVPLQTVQDVCRICQETRIYRLSIHNSNESQ